MIPVLVQNVSQIRHQPLRIYFVHHLLVLGYLPHVTENRESSCQTRNGGRREIDPRYPTLHTPSHGRVFTPLPSTRVFLLFFHLRVFKGLSLCSPHNGSLFKGLSKLRENRTTTKSFQLSKIPVYVDRRRSVRQTKLSCDVSFVKLVTLKSTRRRKWTSSLIRSEWEGNDGFIH